ncbi:hypothetical protein ACERII_07480 [Evansella sp. AB-rgal1]|uniref:hypothetical protein n=1 Tax=Evansella sp. AB-rgal1 TaxID=3242696 RepID=UPI00359DDD60
MIWLAIILGLVILAFVISAITSKRSKKEEIPEESKKSCKNCDHLVPINYTKSLCPQCKGFLT